MKDLHYILGIGFSGTDIWRAIIVAFFLAMLAGKKHSVWVVALVALAIDRFIWPVIAMAVSGANIHTVYATIAGFGETFARDLGLYLVRYLGLTVMIAAFVAARARLHQMMPAKKGGRPAAV